MNHITATVPALSSDEFNQGVADMIGNLFGSIFMLLSPLFSAFGFLVILYLVLRAAFNRSKHR
jgi:hypothetical protein